MKKILIILLVFGHFLSSFGQFSGGGSGGGVSQLVTRGRVLALLDLASTTHANTDPGTKIPFTGTVYTSGMTTNAGSIIPTVTGRYRADWLCMSASTEFLADGIFHVVQNGVSVGQVSFNMNEASAVNQSAGFIEVDLIAGAEVSLHYRTRHTTTDGISWDRGSYFQLTQSTNLVSVSGQSVDYLKVKRITSNQALALNTDILFNSSPTGNISYNSTTGLASLIAGKSYRIKAKLVARNDGTGTTGRYITYDIKTSANADLPTTSNPTQGVTFLATSVLNESGGSEATADFTPTVDTDIKIRITGIDGSNIVLDTERSYFEIVQLGSSSVGTTAMNDQASSGYFDIGNMRIQWGDHNDGNLDISTETLPAPFANNTYTVSLVNSGGSAFSASVEARTTTTFNIDRSSTATTTETWGWIAIGLKP